MKYMFLILPFMVGCSPFGQKTLADKAEVICKNNSGWKEYYKRTVYCQDGAMFEGLY